MAILGAFGLSAAAIVGVSFGIFRLLGDRWLKAKFDERLEKYKHAQQNEMENLRYKINYMLDRTVKLNQSEFEVLPHLWNTLNDAVGEAMRVTSPLQTHADLDRMSGLQLEEHLAASSLAESQKVEIRGSSEKNKLYFRFKTWIDLNNGQNKCVEFNNYYLRNLIFVQKKIRDKIEPLRDMMFDAIHEKRFEQEHGEPREGRYAKSELLRKEGSTLLDGIGDEIQSRLWTDRFITGLTDSNQETAD